MIGIFLLFSLNRANSIKVIPSIIGMFKSEITSLMLGLFLRISKCLYTISGFVDKKAFLTKVVFKLNPYCYGIIDKQNIHSTSCPKIRFVPLQYRTSSFLGWTSFWVQAICLSYCSNRLHFFKSLGNRTRCVK